MFDSRNLNPLPPSSLQTVVEKIQYSSQTVREKTHTGCGWCGRGSGFLIENPHTLKKKVPHETLKGSDFYNEIEIL